MELWCRLLFKDTMVDFQQRFEKMTAVHEQIHQRVYRFLRQAYQ